MIDTQQMVKRCTICRVADGERMYAHPHLDVLRCKRCGLVYVDPHLSLAEERLIGNKASRNGTVFIAEVYEAKHDFWLSYFNAKLDRIERFHPPGRILDIGCGVGYFLEADSRRGWDTYGIEISKPMVEYAQTKLSLNVLNSTLEEANFPADYFDVVTMQSVIEHLLDPYQTLSVIGTVLKPEGLLMIKTPNQDSLVSALCKLVYSITLGRYLLPIYSPDHLYRFSAETLSRLLETTGFHKVEVELEDDLEILKTRVLFHKRRPWVWSVAMWSATRLAKMIKKENQLVAFARPSISHI